MRKFLKVCLLSSLIMALTGGIIAVGSIAGGGAGAVGNMIRRGELSYRLHNMDIDLLGGHGILTFSDSDALRREEFYDDYDDYKYDDSDYDDYVDREYEHDYYDEGDWEKGSDRRHSGRQYYTGDFVQELKPEAFSKLDVMLGGGSFVMQYSDDDTLYIEGTNVKKAYFYEKNGTVYLEGSGRRSGGGEITLYIPEDTVLLEADFAVGAGYMEIDTLMADEVNLDVGAGELVVDTLEARELDVAIGAGSCTLLSSRATEMDLEVGVGTAEINGSVSGKLNVDNAVGSSILNLSGSESDHNYEIECAAGKIIVGDSRYSGLGTEQKINNGSTSEYELVCAMGTIEINFEEE